MMSLSREPLRRTEKRAAFHLDIREHHLANDEQAISIEIS